MPKANEISIDLKSHKPEVIKACTDQLYKALAGIGEEAEGNAKNNTPVDTGRLKGSINYATQRDRGSGTDQPRATPEELTLYVGTNVEYAVYVEYNEKAAHDDGRAHFLRDSLTDGARYKAIVEAALKAGG